MKEVNLFIPGRICLFGEHSDWASEYNRCKGYAIVSCLDIGIYAHVEKDSCFVFKYNNKHIKLSMCYEELNGFGEMNSYYSYVLEVVCYMLKKYNVGGLKININKCTLPERKGLSSSAAICILVCRAFNKIYDLNLSVEEEMDIAYICERNIGSKCGKMDQVLAYGNASTMVEFNNGNISCKKISIGSDFYFVVVDLNGKKNTKKILDNLNNAFKNKNSDIVNYLTNINKKIVKKAYNYIKSGEIKKLGELMSKTQELFDNNVTSYCYDELNAPILHKVLNDKNIKKYIYGGKLVGSGGDGSVQLLARNKKSQMKLIEYIENELHLKSFSYVLKKSNSFIKKAVIPVAGEGTRMYPYTKVIPKSFIPFVKDNMFKPMLLILIEELLDAGIEEIGLIVNKSVGAYINNFFTSKSFNNDYDSYLKSIYKKIKIIYQNKPLGLGDAILCAENFINKEDFLMVLGDQFYKSYVKISCTKQLLNYYNDFNRVIISVSTVDKKNISKYGIFFGSTNKSNCFKVTDILEKPKLSDIKKKKLDTDCFYAAHGEYILNEFVINTLKKYKRDNPNNEIPFTELLNTYINDNPIYAFIPNGRMYDIGNVESYVDSLLDYYKE